MKKTFRALLSDLDGTLADTEPVHADAWLAVLSRYGLHFDHQWFEQWIGTSDHFLARQVIDEHELPTTISKLQAEKRDLFHAQVLKDGKLFPGVEQAMSSIHAHFKVAIVTNSGRDDAEHIFRATGIDQHAAFSVTASDLEKLKPQPEGYLKAADKFELSPAECIAIEDSPAGSYAAWSAGCYVLGIDHGQTDRDLKAEEVFSSPSEAFERALELFGLTVTIH